MILNNKEDLHEYLKRMNYSMRSDKTASIAEDYKLEEWVNKDQSICIDVVYYKGKPLHQNIKSMLDLI